MKRICLIYCLICLYCGVSAQQKGVSFSSSDTALETAFVRAKDMALSYKGKPGDPVGPWYESALPPRSAFCMRDASHQSIAAEILGMDKENQNMFGLFVKHISDAKDWCSYWEIDHYGKPAKDDYRDDKAFWYNLNGNFDLLNACWQLYLWTGDKTYINGPAFKHFHQQSVTAFIDRWVLQADSLLKRPTHPNAPVPFNVEDAFHRCRGLPSYSEGVPNIKMGIDLVAAIYRGLMSYAEILKVNGKNAEAKTYRDKAAVYQKSIDKLWWNEAADRYYTFYSDNHQFGIDEGETFLLWFDALKAGERKEKTIQHLLANDWNVENLSYFTLIMYQNGQADRAYDYIMHLTNPATARREYPEVSYGVIKGFVEGLMGIAPDARLDKITTLHRGKKGSVAEIKDVPVLKTSITVKHESNLKSVLTNNGNKKIMWQPEFLDNEGKLIVKPAIWVKANGGVAEANRD